MDLKSTELFLLFLSPLGYPVMTLPLTPEKLVPQASEHGSLLIPHTVLVNPISSHGFESMRSYWFPVCISRLSIF